MGPPSTDAGATADESIVAEIHGVFDSLPKVFESMREAGELQRHWPGIRSVLVEPEPLTPAVVQALFRVYSLRCSNHYCFVLHSLSLAKLLGAPDSTRVTLAELGRVFELPANQPEAERWGRVLRLAWLSQRAGPQRDAAEHLLRQLCSPEEHERILAVHTANQTLNRFTIAHRLTLADEPMIETFPSELQALIPEFVQFYMREHDEGQPRPVSSMCSMCRSVRSTDARWYPYDAARELLVEGALFSHGLCPACLEAEGLDID